VFTSWGRETVKKFDKEHLAEILSLESEVDILEKELEHNHVKRLSNNQCSSSAAIFTDVVSNLERVSDHATNIAFAIYDEDQYDIN
jgi:phosphate:Na+ symporter